MKINRKAFYDNYRKHFGKLTQPIVDSLELLINKLETGLFKLPTQMAYMLATIYHETAGTFHPVVEGYWIKKNRVAVLWNYYRQNNPVALKSIFPNGVTGLTYEGRGYVQITHEWNYDKFGLKETPEKALDPKIAFLVMEKGMANGLFTGKTLQQYVNENTTDYIKARKVINGLDRAQLIAGYAVKLEQGIDLVSDELAMQGYQQETYLS